MGKARGKARPDGQGFRPGRDPHLQSILGAEIKIAGTIRVELVAGASGGAVGNELRAQADTLRIGRGPWPTTDPGAECEVEQRHRTLLPDLT